MPGKLSITHYRGDVYRQTFTLTETDDEGTVTPIDLTSKRVRMMIRADKADRATAALVDLGNDETRTGIAVDADGNVMIEEVIDIAAGKYDYDLEVSDAGDDPTTWLTGKFCVTDDATFA